ncbi:MAG: hypothetical protein N3D11_10075, partial [Candidatus Sumerlaeia bacterium]|nr:hypothetical protein [Candidatus Sumerlaeia bacterium]
MTVDQKEAVWGTAPAPPPTGEAASAPETRPRRYPQTRALEVHLPEGFEVGDAPRLVWQIHRAGFNTILLNCFRHGWTAYESPV